MAGTTPVTIHEEVVPSSEGIGGNCALSTDKSIHHQFGAVCGDDIFRFIFENVVSINPLH